MADIELVIKIDEEIYKHILSMQFYIPGSGSGKSLLEKILKAIRTGTPLPKGHGRLKDVDWIDDNCENHYSDKDGSWCYTWKDIEDAPTIIEADKEYEAEVITRGNCMMCGKELTEGLFFCKECEDKANSRK